VEPLGADSLVWAKKGGTSVQLRVTADEPIQVGTPVALAPDARRINLFDAASGRRL